MSTADYASAKGGRGENRAHRSKSTKQGETKEESKMIGQWRIGRTIGKGSSGRVKIAKHAITGKYAAIKIVPKGLILNSRMSVSEAGARADKILLGIEREIVIMKLIDHPNVLNLYDVWETTGELFLIMEYVPGGELFDYLVKRGRLPEGEALHYFQQIVHAVDYCHRFNICHRDLKPENLLLDKDKNIKVADFGMAAWQAGERMLETSCGSPHYASPEIVAGKAYHGSASDIWSCGIILFALITGRLPFDDDNIRVLLLKVKTGIFEMPKEVQGPVRDLLYRMLEKDPQRRITMPEILVHPFFISAPSNNIPGRPLVPPPTLDEVERPVDSAAEIDPDIMGNLKTLWHGAADEEIIAALLCKEKTWEKAIYHLLIKYRNKHLENYNAEEEHPKAPNARPSTNALASAVRDPLKENAHSKSVINKSVATEEQSRPQAPTPTKAQGTQREEYMGPTVQERLAKLNLRPTPQGPRPPMSPRNSDRTSASQSLRPTSIVMEHDHTFRTSVVDMPGSRRESIQAPTVDDTEVQRFFQEVAEQLNSLGVDSSRASGSTPQGSPTLESAAQSGDSSRFADAEEDESDMFMPYTPVTENDAFSVHSFVMGASTQPSISAERNPPDMVRRASVRSNGGASRPRSGFWPEAPTPVQPETHNLPLQSTPIPQSSMPRDASYVYVELGDHLETYDWSDSRSGRGASSINSRWNEATKSGRKALSVRPVPFGPRQHHNDVSDSPKRSWFQNLFNFKPSPYTLWSYESVSITARVLQQQLSLLNVRVANETLVDQIVLRCKFSPADRGASDRSGNRSIYFKIEVMNAMSSSSFKTGASFNLVKGAHSVFKELCDSVRRNYRLDKRESIR